MERGRRVIIAMSSCAVVALLGAACSGDRVDRKAAAVSGGLALAECVGAFAARMGDECARPAEPRAPLPGELPSADGRVPGPGGPFGDEGAEREASAPLPPLKHCADAAEMSAAVSPHLPSLRECMQARNDPGTSCAAIDEAPCPPTVTEAECAYARSTAADACMALP